MQCGFVMRMKHLAATWKSTNLTRSLEEETFAPFVKWAGMHLNVEEHRKGETAAEINNGFRKAGQGPNTGH